jgi:hypothetical protein
MDYKILRNLDGDINYLINQINDYAHTEGYDYGLPLYDDGHISQIRDIIKSWINDLVDERKLTLDK